MYYRIIIENDENRGLVLGTHKSKDTGAAALAKGFESYGPEKLGLVDGSGLEKAKKGDVRTDFADLCVEQVRSSDGEVLAKRLVMCLDEGRSADSWLADSIVESGWTVEGLLSEYEPAIRAEQAKVEADRQALVVRRSKASAVLSQLSDLEEASCYSFPAVQGRQAGKAFYTIQVSFRQLVKLFSFDEDDVLPPEQRAQRQRNEKRVKDLSGYVSENPYDYVLPALTACCDSSMRFEPLSEGGFIGELKIPLSSVLLINDGQHRLGGIAALMDDPDTAPRFRQETIAVTIFFDEGLLRSQQIFADINGNQVKPSNAISMIYDHRSDFNGWVKGLLNKLPMIKPRIEMERNSVPAKSSKLWSIIAFKKAVLSITGLHESAFSEVSGARRANLEELVVDFFDALGDYLPFWQPMLTMAMPAPEVRASLLMGHAAFLEALCVAGHHTAMFHHDSGRYSWSDLSGLATLDVSRTALIWEGRCVVNGRLNKSVSGVKSSAVEVCKHLGVPVPAELSGFEVKPVATPPAGGLIAA